MSDILIIDDNLGIRMGLDHFFTKKGIQVRKARSGETGLLSLKEEEPVAIICDVGLPGLSGFEACRIIKANPSTRDIPVVMISSCSPIELQDKGWQSGADFFVTKPVSPVDVVDDMEVLIKGNFSISEDVRSHLKVIRPLKKEPIKEVSVSKED